MNRFVSGLATAALIVAAAPALAVPLTYTITFSGNTGTTGTAGNTVNASDTTSQPVGGPALNVHVSAYSKTGNGTTSGTITKAYLGNYSSGLGITSTGEDGSSPSHTVDNKTNSDFVVLQFDQKVSLTKTLLDLFADTGSTDSDMTIGYGNTTYTSASGVNPFAAGVNFNTLGITTLQVLGTGTPDPGERDFSALTGSIYANTWIIGADMLRTGTDYDDFKIGSVTAVTNNGAVPEPATWAMMISGFGLIGSAMRRNARKAVIA